ncbi:hypothetical protein CIPAW_15G160800 [Carya illinoinensis]|uniref:Secreted protein n=1 Tax=Carya illinoinensis TaxID=32201 RepID=A0A8T1NG71_CARIL|nr:hypothetical protein CIPAW_15G160800 [Carya illinoinensis]
MLIRRWGSTLLSTFLVIMKYCDSFSRQGPGFIGSSFSFFMQWYFYREKGVGRGSSRYKCCFPPVYVLLLCSFPFSS